ncbi:MAG: TetR/AcrR family transcriptional regulator, partial [Phycisphaerales bacterium]
MSSNARQRLIEAGQRLFFSRGFHAVGLDELLDDVGVTKTTFYNHFDSKDDLVIAVLEAHHDREIVSWPVMLEQHGGSEPRAQLLAIFDVLRLWFEMPEFRGCMFVNAAAEFPGRHDPVHLVARRHFAETEADIRARCVAAGAADPDGLAQQLMMLVSGTLLAYHIDLQSNATETGKELARAILDRHLPT